MSDMVKMFHTGEPAVSVGNKLDVGWQSDMHQMTETGGKWQVANIIFAFNSWLIFSDCVVFYGDLNEARDNGVWGRQWHQLDHMQTICTSFQTDNHTNTSSLNLQDGCSS